MASVGQVPLQPVAPTLEFELTSADEGACVAPEAPFMALRSPVAIFLRLRRPPAFLPRRPILGKGSPCHPTGLLFPEPKPSPNPSQTKLN